MDLNTDFNKPDPLPPKEMLNRKFNPIHSFLPIKDGVDPVVPPRLKGKDGHGSCGYKTQVQSNYFELEFATTKRTLVYHFDLLIKKKNPKSKDEDEDTPNVPTGVPDPVIKEMADLRIGDAPKAPDAPEAPVNKGKMSKAARKKLKQGEDQGAPTEPAAPKPVVGKEPVAAPKPEEAPKAAEETTLTKKQKKAMKAKMDAEAEGLAAPQPVAANVPVAPKQEEEPKAAEDTTLTKKQKKAMKAKMDAEAEGLAAPQPVVASVPAAPKQEEGPKAAEETTLTKKQKKALKAKMDAEAGGSAAPQPVVANVPGAPKPAEGAVVPVDESKQGTVGQGVAFMLPKPKARRIFNEFIKQYPHVFATKTVAYDGAQNAYSTMCPAGLKVQSSYNVEYTDNETNRKDTFRVSVKLAGFVPLKINDLLEKIKDSKGDVQEVLKGVQALEVMFNFSLANSHTVVRNNQFYLTDYKYPAYALGQGKEAFRGYFCSLRPVKGWQYPKLFLNMDVTHTAFYSPIPVDQFLRDFNIKMENRKFNMYERRQVAEIFANKIKVETKHNPNFIRKYKIVGVSSMSALEHTFEYTDKKDKKVKGSVVKYFKDMYDYRVELPHLNCFEAGNNKAMLPMECCRVAPNQRVMGRLDKLELTQFIKHSATNPQERINSTKKKMADNFGPKDAMLKELGITVKTEPAMFDARVLPTPLVLQDPKILNQPPPRPLMVKRGGWYLNKFQNSVPLKNWAVLHENGMRQDVIDHFVKELIRLAAAKRFEIHAPMKIPTSARFSSIDVARQMSLGVDRAKKAGRPLQLILCIIKTTRGDEASASSMYATIKNVGDLQLDVVTQCVKFENVLKANTSTIDNILLKMNAKAGGLNNTSMGYSSMATTEKEHDIVSVVGGPFMVMGADVNHPAPSDKGSPSVVAVVGSYDSTGSRYNCEVRHQTHRVEIIEKMAEITASLIHGFFVQTGKRVLPLRILMLRDGVSESQFPTVLKHELMGMRRGCGMIADWVGLKTDCYQPAITFLSVQKRHHTRFYKPNSTYNVEPGTVVDNVVTDRLIGDFYLVSHQGPLGTSRPAHYTILWDDSRFAIDKLELVVFALCHNNSRCTKSVSLPTPAYYAHLLAFRGKVHLQGAVQLDPNFFMTTGKALEDNYKRATLVRCRNKQYFV